MYITLKQIFNNESDVKYDFEPYYSSCRIMEYYLTRNYDKILEKKLWIDRGYLHCGVDPIKISTREYINDLSIYLDKETNTIKLKEHNSDEITIDSEFKNKPFESEINVPSKELCFINFIDDELLNIDYDKYDKKYNLNRVQGLSNLTFLYEKHNKGFGETGNMTITFWLSNKLNIIIVLEYKSFDELKEYEIDKSLIKYLRTNKFKPVDSINCRMWRYEFYDSNDLKPLLNDKNEINYSKKNVTVNYIRIPINGTKVKLNHYDNSFIEHPQYSDIISELIIS